MNTPDKSPALRKALTPTEEPRLPSNFACTTMRRIRLEQQQSERRERIAAVAVVIAVAALGTWLLAYAFGPAILASLANSLTSLANSLTSLNATLASFAAMLSRPDALLLTLPTLFCLTFFALLNHCLRRRYCLR